MHVLPPSIFQVAVCQGKLVVAYVSFLFGLLLVVTREMGYFSMLHIHIISCPSRGMRRPLVLRGAHVCMHARVTAPVCRWFVRGGEGLLAHVMQAGVILTMSIAYDYARVSKKCLKDLADLR